MFQGLFRGVLRSHKGHQEVSAEFQESFRVSCDLREISGSLQRRFTGSSEGLRDVSMGFS